MHLKGDKRLRDSDLALGRKCPCPIISDLDSKILYLRVTMTLRHYARRISDESYAQDLTNELSQEEMVRYFWDPALRRQRTDVILQLGQRTGRGHGIRGNDSLQPPKPQNEGVLPERYARWCAVILLI